MLDRCLFPVKIFDNWITSSKNCIDERKKMNVEWPNCVSLWRFSIVLENFELEAWSQKDQPAEARRGLLNLQTVRVKFARILGSNKTSTWYTDCFGKWRLLSACINREVFFDSTYLHINQKNYLQFFMKFTQRATTIFNGKINGIGMLAYPALQNGFLHNIYSNSKISTDKFRKFCQSFL